MNRFFKLLVIIVVLIISYSTYLYIKEKTTDWGHKVVICIPVYGQSLALGEEATRITNFDSLRIKYNGRIVTECLDYKFGYIDDSVKKQRIKKLLHYRRRSFELSIYSMAEALASQLGEDTLICIFPGGRGMSGIDSICKPAPVYKKFLYEVKYAYEKSKKRGWNFYVPAICWMQGESDIIEYTGANYKKRLKSFLKNVNNDIKAITNQKEDIRMICYQSNVLTRAEKFNQDDYDCVETEPAQAIVSLINEDSLFWASGPTYPYTFVNEKLHINAIGQQQIGKLDAIAVMNIIKKKEKAFGLIPLSVTTDNLDILIRFHVPKAPLLFDTISVKPIEYYGFSVITKRNENILSHVSIDSNTVRLTCHKLPIDCKVRYAVNGIKMKSGNEHGPRGNLRDSHPLRNWCYQFDIPLYGISKTKK